MTKLATPIALNHIGITVPDIHAAIEWYGKVFGFRRIMGPRRLEPKLSDTAESGHILGPRFRKALQAHLVTANGIGLELFEFHHFGQPAREHGDRADKAAQPRRCD